MDIIVYIRNNCVSCRELIRILRSDKNKYGVLNLKIISIETSPNSKISIVPALCFDDELIAYGKEDIVKKLKESV